MQRLILVNDGQFRWAADEADLRAALDDLGWEWDGWRLQYREPESDGEPPTPYGLLCQRVQPAEGFDTHDDFDGDDPRIVAMFTVRPDLGDGVWAYERAVR